MGIGKSLKKFVKKAAPIVGMVAPFFLGPAAGAFVGAATGAMGGGGLKGALMGGLGGYAAGNFGRGFGAGFAGAGGAAPGSLMGSGMAGQGTSFLSKLGSGLKGGLGSLAKGFGMGPQSGIMNAITSPTNIGFDRAGGSRVPTNIGFDRAGAASLPASSGFLGPDTGVGPWSDIAQTAMSGVPHSGEEGEAQLAGNVADMYATSAANQGVPTSQGGFMDFATNLFSEQNIPMTAGIAGMLAQMWENKQNEGKGEVTWGEGIDYSSPTRGTALTTPAAANGGRIGFQQGGISDLYFGDEGEQSLYRDLVRVFTGEITGAEARAVMEAAEGDLGSKAIEMAKQEASYKPSERLNRKANGGIIRLARGGEPTHEMDYRGGGFIPVGAQERADDVPARLSKNEFVMTADAVRAAGGGSIDRGSQRMYDLMNSLEARA
jgi:hypothetical protein